MNQINTLLTAAVLCALTATASAQGLTGRYGRSTVYDIGNPPAVAAASSQHGNQHRSAAQPADGQKLPLRDCAWFEGATRSHASPQYEVGNPGRPGCPPETK